MLYKNSYILVYFHKNALFTPHLHDFDDLRTFVAKFCRNNLRTFSANLLGLKNSTAKIFAFWMYGWCPKEPPEPDFSILERLAGTLPQEFDIWYSLCCFKSFEINHFIPAQTETGHRIHHAVLEGRWWWSVHLCNTTILHPHANWSTQTTTKQIRSN